MKKSASADAAVFSCEAEWPPNNIHKAVVAKLPVSLPVLFRG